MAAVTKLPVKKGNVGKAPIDSSGDDAVAALVNEANAIAEDSPPRPQPSRHSRAR